MTDRYRGSEGSVEWTEKSNSPFSFSRFFTAPSPPLPNQPCSGSLNKGPKGLPGSNESQMNRPDITSACLYSTLQFPFQLQHVSYNEFTRLFSTYYSTEDNINEYCFSAHNKVGSHNAILAQRSFLCGSHGARG